MEYREVSIGTRNIAYMPNNLMVSIKKVEFF